MQYIDGNGLSKADFQQNISLVRWGGWNFDHSDPLCAVSDDSRPSYFMRDRQTQDVFRRVGRYFGTENTG